MRNNDVSGEEGLESQPGGLQRLLIAGSHFLQVGIPAAGLLTFLADVLWVADLLANLRLQLVMAGVVATVIALVSKQWKTLTAQLLILCIHANWIVNSPDRAVVADGSPDLSVTALNAYINNDQHEVIAAALKGLSADVITVTELSSTLNDHLKTEFSDSHPYVAAVPYLGVFGVGIFSRYPLTDIELIGSATTGASLLATVNMNDHRFRIAAVHSISPMTPGTFRLRNHHLRALSDAVQAGGQQRPEIPFIVTGDFNLTPWSPHFTEFQQSSGLVHVAQDSGVEPTWYARGRTLFPLGLVLDHCMVSPQLNCVSRQIGPSVASDHLPLTVRLSNQP